MGRGPSVGTSRTNLLKESATFMRPARSVSPKTQAQADEAAQLAVQILGQEGGARSQLKKAVKLGVTKVAVQFVPAKPPLEGMCWT